MVIQIFSSTHQLTGLRVERLQFCGALKVITYWLGCVGGRTRGIVVTPIQGCRTIRVDMRFYLQSEYPSE